MQPICVFPSSCSIDVLKLVISQSYTLIYTSMFHCDFGIHTSMFRTEMQFSLSYNVRRQLTIQLFKRVENANCQKNKASETEQPLLDCYIISYFGLANFWCKKNFLAILPARTQETNITGKLLYWYMQMVPCASVG